MNISIFAHGDHEDATSTVQAIVSGSSDISPIALAVISLALTGLMLLIRRVNK